MNRKSFIQNTAMAGLGILANPEIEQNMEKNIFIHHVYFWLKEPKNNESFEKLLKGLDKLSQVKTIKTFHIGKPADTNRDVIDRSYSVSWMLMFANKADQDAYQIDSIHLKFVEECSSLWSKVVVYDSVDVK